MRKTTSRGNHSFVLTVSKVSVHGICLHYCLWQNKTALFVLAMNQRESEGIGQDAPSNGRAPMICDQAPPPIVVTMLA